MTIPSLPGEIIFQILEAGYFSHKFRPDRYFLNSCCQVCRTWAAEAQPLLFRHLEVRRPSSLAGLKEALTHPNHRRNALKDVVLWLRIWIGFDDDSVSSLAALSSLLATCSNLYGLSVTFCNVWTFFEEYPILPPNVVVLECCNWGYNLGTGVARSLIRSGWHSLRILILRGYLLLDEIPPYLSELRIEGPFPKLSLIEDALTVNKLQLNLRSLEVTNYPSFDRILEICQHSLESVRTPRNDPSIHLKNCLRLREFITESFIQRNLFQALRGLPLEHLAYSILPTWSSADFSRECVSLSPSLRVVSCLTSIRPWDEGMTKYIDDLEHICDKKNVRLDYYTTLISFRAFTRGSPVPTNNFPRELVVPSYSQLRVER